MENLIDKLVCLKDNEFDAAIARYPAWLLYDIAEAYGIPDDDAAPLIWLNALKLRTEASKRGDPRAMLFVAQLVPPETPEIDVSQLLKPAQLRYRCAPAMIAVGDYYIEEGDYEKAIKYYVNAGLFDEEGTSFLRLGDCYLQGIGVEQDYEKARELFSKAICLHNPEGYYKTAVAYIKQDSPKMPIEERKKKIVENLESASRLGLRQATEAAMVIFNSL